MNKTTVAQQAKTTSVLSPPQGVLQRKCACGNSTFASGECAECAKKKGMLQRKLSIGASNDPLELEADRIADQVMASLGHSVTSRAPLHIQRFTRQAIEGTDTASASVDRALAGSGRPLEPVLRHDMEQRFGHDFSQVRVHSGSAAEQSTRELNANAYTVGHNIVFGKSQYVPGDAVGRHLLAHELTHVVQQRAGGFALQRRAANCPDAPPSPPTITTMDDFIALVRRVEASTMTGGNPIATAQLISRTKYEGRTWDWMLPSTKGQPGVSKDRYDVGKITADDVGSLCFKLIVSLPGGGMEDPMHVIAAIVADAETLPAGSGATGLSKHVDPLPVSVSQRGASTWVGDVGKAAGDWMAVVPLPKGGSTKADYMLDSAPPHDLMSDVDGVAMTSKSAASGFAFDKTKPLSDNLQRFFAPAKRTGRERRFHVFCSAEGFALEADGITLTDGAKKTIGQRVKDFANWMIKNDPHILAYLAVASGSWHFSKALVERADDWQWFANEFIKFVEKNLKAEGP
ncbi:MAG: eCIS core domain-containing protein [Methylobacter sp.]